LESDFKLFRIPTEMLNFVRAQLRTLENLRESRFHLCAMN